MHIPDGYLSPPVWAALDVAAIPMVGWAARRAQRGTDERKVPLLGVMGAFVFAAQMINFPVGTGVSGHLVGGALLAVTLGPAAATVVMTAVVALQALIFQDGGILALGANVCNMALLGVAAGYLPCMLLGRTRVAIFAGGLLSVMTSATLALSELFLSGVRMPGTLMWAALGLFLATAILEGAITVVAVGALDQIVPALSGRDRTPAPGRRAVGAVGLVAVTIIAAGSLVASASPDGLQHIASELGLSETGSRLDATWIAAPMAGYRAPGVASEWLGTTVAGIAGLLLLLAAFLLVGRLLARRRSA